ncbi:MAG TPA: hypothetical protein VLL96_01760 [Candidatus Deferrimicrobiaceae bacterium]|nr:hypothetical protein [Candidatus Deferrimicrobiaceae bacterium]
MLQNLIVKPPPPIAHFSLNMPGVDDIFPGLAPGDFAVLYGSQSVVSLTSLLCVRAQLPMQLGGLASNVVFIDGGNTFRLYNIARFAQLHYLNPKEALERIFISRAFTAYQLTSLIMEKLEEAVKVYNAKLVVISDVAGFFLDSDVPAEEAQKIYGQIVGYLSDFAKKYQIIIVATYLPYESGKRNTRLQEITFSKANTVLCFAKTKYAREVALEKHPRYMLGVAELPSEKLTLTDFMGSNTVQMGLNVISS